MKTQIHIDEVQDLIEVKFSLKIGKYLGDEITQSEIKTKKSLILLEATTSEAGCSIVVGDLIQEAHPFTKNSGHPPNITITANVTLPDSDVQ